ncbi:MAG: phosphoribosylanthranilate isomerase [Planktomarina sp.]
MAKIRMKFCGLTQPNDVTAAARVGAAYIGFVFFPKSPRNVSIDQARELAVDVPVGIAKTALLVDPTDDELDAILAHVPLDMIQLHGGEPPRRVAHVRARAGLPVMKAVGIADADDVAHAHGYAKAADQLLLDAKAPKDADLPGGNGHAFDWSLIKGEDWSVPWMLAGGLTPETVADAVRQSGARQVDVSSGIESQPGVKDPARMEAFAAALQHKPLP